MDKCIFTQSCRKYVQTTLHIMEQQRLWQAKKRNLSAKEVKDLNAFVKGKINEMIKEHHCNMHVMSNFEDMSLSSSNKSVQSIISNNSEGVLTTRVTSWLLRNEAMAQNKKGINLGITKI
eukprot:15366348-Ditylum_brightwellii.AAC.1